MNNRQATILKILINEHIQTAQAVSSNFIVDKYHLNISSATVRNELMELENEGYIIQPHTSAGRIPTEKAYHWYLAGLDLDTVSTSINWEQETSYDEPGLKSLAKQLAESSGLAVFWAFHRHNVYYTGITKLLHQPEFAHGDTIYDISDIIDRVDEIINDNFNNFIGGPQILLGQKSPFGPSTATVLSKYQADTAQGVFGILGPLRQNYQLNWQLIKYLYEKIQSRQES